jgi:hypothetical protein
VYFILVYSCCSNYFRSDILTVTLEIREDTHVQLEQMEPGLVRKPCDVKYSRRIVKEVLKPLAMAKWLLFIWFQQLFDRCHSVWPKLCLLGSYLTCGIRVAGLMGQSLQIFYERPL